MKLIQQALSAARRLLRALFAGPLRWVSTKTRQLIAFLERNDKLANAIATLASAIIALVALFVSGVSVYLTREALKDQRRHDILSVRPLPTLTVFDGDERLEVLLRNNGPGPLIVRDVEVSDGRHSKRSIIDWMPDLPQGMRWETFASEMSERSFAPGGDIALIRLTGKQSDPAFRGARDKCRAELSKLTVSVKYTDVYESAMAPHVRNLSWFGRHLKTGASPATPP